MESLLSLKEDEQLLSVLALRGGGGGGSGEPHLRVPAEITVRNTSLSSATGDACNDSSEDETDVMDKDIEKKRG